MLNASIETVDVTEYSMRLDLSAGAIVSLCIDQADTIPIIDYETYTATVSCMSRDQRYTLNHALSFLDGSVDPSVRRRVCAVFSLLARLQNESETLVVFDDEVKVLTGEANQSFQPTLF